MNYSSNLKIVKERFKTEFPDLSMDYRSISLGQGEIHSFFVRLTSEGRLTENWRLLSNFFALYFQNQIKDEFEKWNLYVFYLVNKPVSNSIRYLIENDTFSSRKIVVENESEYDQIIAENILNNNLNVASGEQVSTSEIFVPNSILWENLNSKTLKRKKRLDAANDALDAIVKRLGRR